MNKRRRFLCMLKEKFHRKKAKTFPKPYVRPVKGCILKCDLTVLLEHTGIYIGNGNIVGLNRHGQIRIEDEQSFFPPGTDAKKNNIYTACFGDTDEVLACPYTYKRAKKKIDNTSPYNMLFNNCHRFTCGCLTGDFENEIMSFSQLEQAILNNIDSLRTNKNLWTRFKHFFVKTKANKETPSFNWRPVIFDSQNIKDKN